MQGYSPHGGSQATESARVSHLVTGVQAGHGLRPESLGAADQTDISERGCGLWRAGGSKREGRRGWGPVRKVGGGGWPGSRRSKDCRPRVQVHSGDRGGRGLSSAPVSLFSLGLAAESLGPAAEQTRGAPCSNTSKPFKSGQQSLTPSAGPPARGAPSRVQCCPGRRGPGKRTACPSCHPWDLVGPGAAGDRRLPCQALLRASTLAGPCLRGGLGHRRGQSATQTCLCLQSASPVSPKMGFAAHFPG